MLSAYFNKKNKTKTTTPVSSGLRLNSAPVINEHWTYLPGALDDVDFLALMKEVTSIVHEYSNVSNSGVSYPSKRLSCRVYDFAHDENINVRTDAFNYDKLKSYDWSQTPMIDFIRKRGEALSGETYQMALVHLYRDGKDGLGFHQDKEAWSSSVFSMSFGETAAFRIRSAEATSGFDEELMLKHGDCLKMQNRMQRVKKHAVLPSKKRLGPRVNITLRQVDHSYKSYSFSLQQSHKRPRDSSSILSETNSNNINNTNTISPTHIADTASSSSLIINKDAITKKVKLI